MTFDIYRLDELDEYDYEDAESYQDELHELFVQSPEGQAFLEVDPDMGFWSYQMMYYAFGYIGVTLPNLDESDVEQLFTDVMPRKISISEESDLVTAVDEMIAFWQFLKRAYKLPNADEILAYLKDEKPHFAGYMNDPSKFGMAKSFFMQGEAAGFDMSNESQINAFMNLHNAAIAKGLPGMVPSLDSQRENDSKSVQKSVIKRRQAKARKQKRKKQRRR